MAEKPIVDDVALFGAAMQDVRRLPPTGRVVPDQRQTLAQGSGCVSTNVGLPDASGLTQWQHIDVQDETYDGENGSSFVRGGLQKNALRRLRRAMVEAELDLHGLTRASAQDAVVRFVAACQQRGLRCVCMVTGKGYGSPGGRGILRQLLPAWLRQLAAVLAFCPAPARNGGEGAWLVWLATDGAQIK